LEGELLQGSGTKNVQIRPLRQSCPQCLTERRGDITVHADHHRMLRLNDKALSTVRVCRGSVPATQAYSCSSSRRTGSKCHGSMMPSVHPESRLLHCSTKRQAGKSTFPWTEITLALNDKCGCNTYSTRRHANVRWSGWELSDSKNV
jgi:hypothetical protein